MTIKIPDSLPFKAVEITGNRWRIDDENGSAIASMFVARGDDNNAAYLVHAANNYPALVKSLEALMDSDEMENLESFQQKLKDARAALRAAKGE